MIPSLQAILFDLPTLAGPGGDPQPGAVRLLAEIRAAGLKTALIGQTADPPAWTDAVDHWVQPGRANRPPPAPDYWLAAIRELGIPPAGCIAVTGSGAGVRAAAAAGLPVAAVGSSAELTRAEVLLPNLMEADPERISYAATYRVAEETFLPERQGHRETLFTIGNGYLSTRGTLEERFPGDQQATLIHGLWDDVPIHFTELVNAPDWTRLEIHVNGDRFSLDQGQVREYARWLDLRDGVLHRRLTWRAPVGISLQLHFQRFPSLARQHILAQQVEITPLNGPAEIRAAGWMDSEVDTDGRQHWEQVSPESHRHSTLLVLRTLTSRKLLAAAVRLTGRIDKEIRRGSLLPDRPGEQLTAACRQGETLQVKKITAVSTSRDGPNPQKAVRTLLEEALDLGYEALLQEQRAAWQNFWATGDVLIHGDNFAQQAVRFSLFQLRCAAPTVDDQVSIGAKALSGFGYRGHVFWDTEIFMLPYFIYSHPELARNMLLYRVHRLPGARRKAAASGCSGAQYPWESAETGDEVSPQWMPDFDNPDELVRIWTGDLQIHITADIAYALHHYWQVTGDDFFWLQDGIPVVLETALFWGDRVEEESGQFSIRNVIGPDEYHDHVDNNAYTNAMVCWHLETALDAVQWLREHHPEQLAVLSSQLNLDAVKFDHWRRITEKLVLLQDPESGVIEQFEGFFALKELNWAEYTQRDRSLQELLGIQETNHYQVVKQADVLALLCLLDEQFDQETWQANWDVYAPITDHRYGSSLGPALHAWAACRVGKTEQAYDYFLLSAGTDLEDNRGNAADGIHAANAGGIWQAVVFGFAGLEIKDGALSLSPQLPAHWKRLEYCLAYRGKLQRVVIRDDGTQHIHPPKKSL